MCNLYTKFVNYINGKLISRINSANVWVIILIFCTVKNEVQKIAK